MSNNRERAKRLLKNYLRYGVKASGLKWDSDNDAEVEDIVDCLIDAAKSEMSADSLARIDRLEMITDAILEPGERTE